MFVPPQQKKKKKRKRKEEKKERKKRNREIAFDRIEYYFTLYRRTELYNI